MFYILEPVLTCTKQALKSFPKQTAVLESLHIHKEQFVLTGVLLTITFIISKPTVLLSELCSHTDQINQQLFIDQQIKEKNLMTHQ